MSPPLQAAWVLALGSILAALLSAPLLIPRMLQITHFSVIDPWSPAWLRSPWLYIGAVTGPPLLALVACAAPSRARLRVWAAASAVAGAVLLIHPASFGWAGSVLLFWSGVWAVYLATVQQGHARGPGLCLVLLGGLFALPALGKVTPGYLDGSVFYELHGAHGRGVYGLLASGLGMDPRALARLFGPLSIAGELAVATAWLWPGRWGFGLAAAVACGILTVGGWSFIDAMAPLLALTASGWVLARQLDRADASVDRASVDSREGRD